MLGVDWGPALDDLGGVTLAVFEFGFKGAFGREPQVQGEFVLEDDGDGVGLGGGKELDLLRDPAFDLGYPPYYVAALCCRNMLYALTYIIDQIIVREKFNI